TEDRGELVAHLPDELGRLPLVAQLRREDHRLRLRRLVLVEGAARSSQWALGLHPVEDVGAAGDDLAVGGDDELELRARAAGRDDLVADLLGVLHEVELRRRRGARGESART